MRIKANYYIALVGKNPLPNYISALNFCDEETKVFFVYTEGGNSNIGTSSVAQNIIDGIKAKIEKINPQKVSCDKSDNIKISECFKSFMDEIVNECKALYIHEERPKIILDYTGATKSMAAVFFDLCNIYQEENEDINFCASYVANKNKCVYEMSFKDLGNNISCYNHKMEYISSEFGISVEDIVRLHGYEMIKSNNNFMIYKDEELIFREDTEKIKEVKINNFDLKITFDTEAEKVKELVDKFFYLNDIAERIGGSEVKLEILTKSLIQVNNKIMSNEEAINRFYENVSNISSRDNVKKKVKITIKEEEV